MSWSLKNIFAPQPEELKPVEMSPVRDREVAKVEPVEKVSEEQRDEWEAPEGTMVNGWKVYKFRRTNKGVMKVIRMEEVDEVIWKDGKVDRLVDWDPMDLRGFEGGKIADEDRWIWIERMARVRPWVTRKKMAETMGVSLVTVKRELAVLESQFEMAYWGNSRFGHWVVGKEEVMKYSPAELDRYK